MRQLIIKRTCQYVRYFSVKSPEKTTAIDANKETKNHQEYWHEEKLTKNETVHWNYRKEIVSRLNMDNSHSHVWLSIAVSTVVGIILFIWVKSDLLDMRKKQMAKRERERRERQLAEAEKYPSL